MALSQPTGIGRPLTTLPPMPNIHVRDVLARIHDDHIEALLGAGHLFADSLIYVLIGAMIAEQPDGEEGTLSTDSDNLFYTPSSFVNAYLDDTSWQIVKLRRDHPAVLELIDRGDGESQLCHRVAIKPIGVPFERHRDEHRRIARKPRLAVAPRDFVREPSCIFRRILRDTSPRRHKEQNKNAWPPGVKLFDKKAAPESFPTLRGRPGRGRLTSSHSLSYERHR